MIEPTLPGATQIVLTFARTPVASLRWGAQVAALARACVLAHDEIKGRDFLAAREHLRAADARLGYLWCHALDQTEQEVLRSHALSIRHLWQTCEQAENEAK